MRINMALSAAFVCSLFFIHNKIPAIADMIIVYGYSLLYLVCWLSSRVSHDYSCKKSYRCKLSAQSIFGSWILIIFWFQHFAVMFHLWSLTKLPTCIKNAWRIWTMGCNLTNVKALVFSTSMFSHSSFQNGECVEVPRHLSVCRCVYCIEYAVRS
jgi:ABC-type glucose/galactose transport system permease subunit